MTSERNSFFTKWEGELVSLRRRLGYFEQSRMKWKVDGVDCTPEKITLYRRVISSIEEMLEAARVRELSSECC